MRNLAQFYSDFWVASSTVLGNMNFRGIGIDSSATLEKAQVATSIIEELDLQLNAWASDYTRQLDEPMNWNSSTQVCRFLHDFKGYPISPVKGKPEAPQRNKDKARTSSGAAIAWFIKRSKSGTDIDMLRVLAKRNKTATLKQFLVKLPTLLDSNGRIHSNMAARTNTGRLKSSLPNLQAIPTHGDFLEMRKGFVPKPGYSFIVADYSQLEMYIMAHYMILLFDDHSLYDDLLTGDVHTETAFRIWGPELEALGANRANIKEVAKHIRGWAKTLNYAVSYGKTAHGLGDQITSADGSSIGTAAAQVILDAFFEAYSGLKRLYDYYHAQAREYGHVYTLLGRTRPLPDIHSNEKWLRQSAERKAQNTPIQGSAADIVTAAMLTCNGTKLAGHEKWYNKELDNLDCRMVLQVHDELIFEVPTENATEAKAEVVVRMENPFTRPLKVQLKVDADIGPSWGHCK